MTTGVGVQVNGQDASVAEGTTIQQLVLESGIGTRASSGAGERRGRGVAVAVNGEVVPRSAWADTELRPGDRVEILNAVGGG